jgi:hypothetical protein
MPERITSPSLTILRYAPHEWFERFDQPEQIQEMERQLRLHGFNPDTSIVAPLEKNAEVIRTCTFGNRGVVEGVAWAVLRNSVENPDMGGPTVLDVAFGEVEFDTVGTLALATFDAQSLEPAPNANPSRLLWGWQYSNPAIRPQPLRPQHGRTLDAAARLIFAADTR